MARWLMCHFDAKCAKMPTGRPRVLMAILVLGLLLLGSCADQGSEPGDQALEGAPWTNEDLDRVSQTLTAFIAAHQETLIREFNDDPPTAESVRGFRGPVVEGHWGLGRWGLRGNRDRCSATYGETIGIRRAILLTIELKRRGAKYEIVDFGIGHAN